jgi:hypothetical protein
MASVGPQTPMRTKTNKEVKNVVRISERLFSMPLLLSNFLSISFMNFDKAGIDKPPKG